MPLVRHVAPKPEEAQAAQQLAADVVTSPVSVVAPKIEETKPVYTGRKAAAASDTMSKAEWAHKDARISLQGVLQALLSSVSFGQYCTGTTADDYLVLVEGAALRLARFVKEHAE